MKSLQMAFVGVAFSFVAILLISTLFKVDLGKVTEVGLALFTLASSISVARLVLQGIRFHVFVQTADATKPVSKRKSMLVRIASEFITLSTPAYIAGEVLRIAWMRRQGVSDGRALWVGFLELFIDVLVGVTVSLIAAGLAIYRGAHLIALLVVGASIPVLGIYLTILWLALKRRVRTPTVLHSLVSLITGKERSERLVHSWNRALTAFSENASETFLQERRRPLISIAVYSLLLPLTSGLTLWVIFRAFTPDIDLLDSILTAYVAIAVGTLPITPGGSGLSEAAVFLYASSVFGFGQWAPILAYRLASYHVPLIATAFVALYLLRGELKADADFR